MLKITDINPVTRVVNFTSMDLKNLDVFEIVCNASTKKSLHNNINFFLL